MIEKGGVTDTLTERATMPDAEAILLTLPLPRCRIDSQPCRCKVPRSRNLKLRTTSPAADRSFR
jgi:hypothetical protein